MNKGRKSCSGCERLQTRIDELTEQLKDSRLEWSERGKELEQVNALVTAWDVQMRPELFAQLRDVLDVYIERCTCKGSTGKKKYQRGAARWKSQTKKIKRTK